MTFRYWRNGWSDKLTLTPSLTQAYKTHKNLVKFCRLSRLLKAWTDDAQKTSLSRLFQVSMQQLAKLKCTTIDTTRLYCFCILKQCPQVILSDSVKKDANFNTAKWHWHLRADIIRMMPFHQESVHEIEHEIQCAMLLAGVIKGIWPYMCTSYPSWFKGQLINLGSPRK